jgi:hypothetical protein
MACFGLAFALLLAYCLGPLLLAWFWLDFAFGSCFWPLILACFWPLLLPRFWHIALGLCFWLAFDLL